ncbi:hypothetical protein SAY86_011488 [Trapa natans]|uniref:Uncharacterized protein n=1 Tax=Trapa natans TaxID=22666 RepID=A0AAN7R4A2_TRANT|nr:hypothetical protein SAY86_011488 [Trapa natans]
MKKILSCSRCVQASIFEPEDAQMEEDLEQLELEVQNMAEKILHYRSTLSEQLKNAFAVLASAHRPEFPQVDSGSEPRPSGAPRQGNMAFPKLLLPLLNGSLEGKVLDGPSRDSELVSNSPVSESYIDTAKKIELLKEKTMKNIAALHGLLKRLKGCVSAIDNLDSHPSIIHPAFRKDRTS